MNTRIAYLDAHSLSDLLFVEKLGRVLAAARPEIPLILVHAVTEQVSQYLDGQNIEHRWVGDELVVADDSRGANLQNVVRYVNRRLVSSLTETGVAASSIQGSDRGLLTLAGDDLAVSRRCGWLSDLAGTGAVPVVSPLAVLGADSAALIPPSRAIKALAEAFDSTQIALFTRTGKPGVWKNEHFLGEITTEEVPPSVYDTGHIGPISTISRPVYLTNVENLPINALFHGTLLT